MRLRSRLRDQMRKLISGGSVLHHVLTWLHMRANFEVSSLSVSLFVIHTCRLLEVSPLQRPVLLPAEGRQGPAEGLPERAPVRLLGVAEWLPEAVDRRCL